MRSRRAFTISILIILALSALPAAAQTVVDNFDRATLGANWTADPEYVIVSNTLDNSATTALWNYLALYNAVTNPFEVQYKWAASGDAEGVNSGGFAMIMDANSVTANGYFIMRRYSSIDIHPIVNGNVDRTVLIATATPTQPTPAPGNTVKLVFRTDATAYYFDYYLNGVLDATLKDNRTARPAIPATYYAGVSLYGNRNNNIDDFSVKARGITVTSPNGGETWLTNSVHAITWTNADFSGNVAIEYSLDGGTSWSTITASVSNTGTYNWTLPSTSSNTCRVRVKDAADGNPADISNANFIIEPETESLVMVSPNGGENWVINTQQEIRWSGSSSIGYVKLEYSTNNGTTWSTIVNNELNDGSFMWTLPAPITTQALIRVSDAFDGMPSDASNGTFSISSLVTLRVKDSSGEPGTSGNLVSVWLDNLTNLRGISFKLTDSPNNLTAINVLAVGRASGFTVVMSENGTSVTIFLVHMSGGVIPVGSGAVLQISYNVAVGATLETFSTMDLSTVTISDANSDLVVPELVQGEFHYIKSGDLDASGTVDQLDIDRVADLVLKRGAAPSAYELLCGDLDHDGDVDLFDLMTIFDIVY